MKALIIALTASFGLTAPAFCAPATSAGRLAANPSAAQSAPAGAELSKAPDDLKASLSAYQSAHDAPHWQACWKNFVAVISECVNKHIPSASVISTIPALTDLGLTVADSGNIKVWSFPKVAESDQILVYWQDSVAGAATVVKGKSGRLIRRAAPAVSAPHLQIVACPAGSNVSAGRLLVRASTAAAGAAGKTTGKAMVLLGVDRKTGSVWLSGYKLADGRWTPCPELFSGVPPFLIQNLQGKVSFAGNNLVVQIEAPKPAGAAPADDSDKANGGGYKISLIYTGDHYALDSKSGLDPATTVAMQFVQALQAGKMDMVKAWLADPKLASIPGYLGLYSRGASAPAFKLVPMVTPSATGISRFRLVTFDRDDLIMDVGRLKATQWAVKALFIAPSDPLAKKLAM